MSESAFDCSICRHSVSRHTTPQWPLFTKLCRDCNCTGYHPNYRNTGG